MIGRPGNPHGTENEKLHCVTFLIDDEHLEMLRELEGAAGENVYGRRSQVLRRLIKEAHDRHRHSKK